MSEARNNRVSVVIEDSLKERLKILATHFNRKMSDYIRLILLDFCEYGEAQMAQDLAEEEDAEST